MGTDWGTISAIVIAALIAAFATTQWIYDLRPDRLRRFGVDDGNTFIIQFIVLGLTGFCLYLTVAEILDRPVPSWLYFGFAPLVAGFAIAALVGRLAERDKMWVWEGKRRVKLRWDRVRKVVLLPFVAPFAPLSTGALKHAPDLLPLFR